MISWVRDAEAQVQQRVSQASYETHSKKGTWQEGRDIDGSPVSAKACNWISPVLRDLWKESDFQSRYSRLEDLHRMPRHSTRQKPEPNLSTHSDSRASFCPDMRHYSMSRRRFDRLGIESSGSPSLACARILD